jgi:phage terminase large subunit-like protein
MQAETRAVLPMRIAGRAEAEELVAGVLATMKDLEALLEAETAHVRVGRLREGLSQETRKSQLAASYMQGLETIKANAVALARFAPESLERLKSAHRTFAETVGTNQVVLATARAVSETLVKGIAEEMNRHARPQGYAPAGYGARRSAPSEPLVISKSL